MRKAQPPRIQRRHRAVGSGTRAGGWRPASGVPRAARSKARNAHYKRPPIRQKQGGRPGHASRFRRSLLPRCERPSPGPRRACYGRHAHVSSVPSVSRASTGTPASTPKDHSLPRPAHAREHHAARCRPSRPECRASCTTMLDARPARDASIDTVRSSSWRRWRPGPYAWAGAAVEGRRRRARRRSATAS
jgi:hypothetical protein